MTSISQSSRSTRSLLVDFPLDVGDYVEIKHCVGFSHWPVGTVALIEELIVRFDATGSTRYYRLKGSSEQVPVLCCKPASLTR